MDQSPRLTAPPATSYSSATGRVGAAMKYRGLQRMAIHHGRNRAILRRYPMTIYRNIKTNKAEHP